MLLFTDKTNKCKFRLGPDGVAQIYADAPKGSKVYMGNSGKFDEKIFNVSYGRNSHIDYEAKKQGKLNYFTTEGSKINYHSGAQSGRSTRIDTYAGGGMWSNDTDYSWKDNPGYLYNEKGTLNSEFTTYIRVHGDMGTHQAYAHKIGGRDEDALRSLAEMVYPTSGKREVAFNYNYAHFPYVHARAKTYGDLEEFGENFGWLALKTIHFVRDGYTHWEMWADFDPVADDGSLNNNWLLIAEYKDEGCDEYDNIPLSWRAHKQVCRVDGFEQVDFALFSDREIDPSATLTTQFGNKILGPKVGIVKDVKAEQSTKAENKCCDPHDSSSGVTPEEYLQAETWLKQNPNAPITKILRELNDKYCTCKGEDHCTCKS